MNLHLSTKQLKALDVYRENRRQERGGKVLQRKTAAMELLMKGLEGIKPATPAADRMAELEHRVKVCENASLLALKRSRWYCTDTVNTREEDIEDEDHNRLVHEDVPAFPGPPDGLRKKR